MKPEKKAMLDSLFEAFSILASGKYVYLCDLSEDISRWSHSAVSYFGLPSDYMNGAGAIWEAHIHPDDREEYARSIQKIFAGEESEHDMQYRARTKEGDYVVCTCRGVIIRDGEGNPAYFGGTIQNHNILSYIDPVTGLRSLYGFFDDLRSMFWNQEHSTILMLGLSSFSSINDLYGYTFGNAVLHAITKLLKREFRNAGVLYRLDGTKFAVITRSKTTQEVVEAYERIKLAASHDFCVDHQRLSLALNGGVVHVDNFDISTETAYSCLKYAYYQSKDRKLGNAVVFVDALTDENRQYTEKLNIIRNCVVDGCKGFYLCYQPIMDANTEQLKGMEALLRWQSDEYGSVPPAQFIDVLEQDTLFPELGRWILRTAMEDGKKLLDDHPDFVMNVNLSYAQLETSTFVSDVLQLLDETGYPPRNLCLEITERCRLLDLTQLKNIFKALHAKGIRLALDDFGTGYSSMNILRELEVDTIKIDRAFVKNVVTNRFDQQTVQSIAKLAESFSADVCVEGVESAEMRDALQQYHVSSLQGYYYSKPIPMEDFFKKYNG